MEIKLPVMSGVEAAVEIRWHENANNEPRVPIIAIIASAMLPIREEFLTAGMDDCLAKPYRPQEARHDPAEDLRPLASLRPSPALHQLQILRKRSYFCSC
jgi:osomolarity two-component system sensor histidine kinase NIK1